MIANLLAVLATSQPSFAAPEAQPIPAGPTLVFDAATGELIMQDRASEAWYPASLTKLVTAYVVFKKIREGKLKLDQQVLVSDLASAQEPSKIGVPAGKTVSLDFALQALLVYSANDMAYVLAEAASGSIGAFSDDMNAEAKRLNLTASHFVNPNGLFDPRQMTSARDIGLIAAAIVNEFPEHQRYFDQQHVAVGKRRLSNRNSLIRSMPDADGMKTGFVCNSGFNLVASATRNGRRLIAVVLGAKSGWARAKLAQAMLETGFTTSPSPATMKLADIKPAATPTIVDMTEKVCPRKSPVLYANAEKFQGYSVSLGFFNSPEKADNILRQRLLDTRGMELSGAGGVVDLPGNDKNATQYAAMVWGLDEVEGETYCEVAQRKSAYCRVFPPVLSRSHGTAETAGASKTCCGARLR